MTRIEIATLACKIIALWFFAEAAMGSVWIIIMGAVAIGSAFSSSGSSLGYELKEVAILGIPPLGQLVVGLFLWFGASRLAARMVSDDLTPVTRPDITASDVLAIGFMTIGVYYLIPNVRALARNIFEMVRGEYGFREWLCSGATLSSIIGFAFSIWLILGSRGIVRAVLWARAAAAKRGGESEAS